MAVAPPTSRRQPPAEPRIWTRAEFNRAEALGLFGPDERLELIDGEIIVKERPLKPPHATAQSRTERVLNRAFEQGFSVRAQLPLALSAFSEPIPDIAIVVGSEDDYAEAHPNTAVLIIEVAETSLQLDRTEKAGMYFRAGIPDYWILNLNDRVLEVYRGGIGASAPPGDFYASVKHYVETDSIAPLAAPDTAITVADLLPPRRQV